MKPLSCLLLLFLFGNGLLRSQSVFDSLYVTESLELFFDFGKSAITTESGLAIDTLVARMGPSASSRIRITAYTDSIGSPQANQALSERRAEAVRLALVQRGLSAGSMSITGKGEREPVGFNSTEEGRQKNRRAVLSVVRTVPMATLSGKITDAEGAGIPEARVFFSTKTRSDSTLTDQHGIYSVRLPKDSVVAVEAVAKDHFFESAMLKVFGSPELYKKYQINTDLVLPSAAAGEKIALRNFYFKGGQAVLLNVSEPELNRVLRFMQTNPGKKIEIAGHVNAPGWTAEQAMSRGLMDLSVARAKLVYDFLIRNGIPARRMNYKGYGCSQMLFPGKGATEGEQQQNRRVEIRVLE